jgi:hypothetical protein
MGNTSFLYRVCIFWRLEMITEYGGTLNVDSLLSCPMGQTFLILCQALQRHEPKGGD